MALMERVATLLRANMNDLIDRAEDPEKMLKQVVLDMENQLLQVKTRVAVAMADLRMLEVKAREHANEAVMWDMMASKAVSKGEDELARQALDRNLAAAALANSFLGEVEEHRAETEELRKTYLRLEARLRETRGQSELLSARHKRARLVGKMPQVGANPLADRKQALVEKMRDMVERETGVNQAMRELNAGVAMEDRLRTLKREDDVERLLLELKEKQVRMLEAG